LPARQLQHVLVDLTGFDSRHQLQHGLVVGTLAMKEDVPHAARRADEHQAIGLEVFGQGQAEEGHAREKPSSKR
jgi:hypothetical protein